MIALECDPPDYGRPCLHGKSMIIHSNINPGKRSVLIVDNDPAVRASLQFWLQIEGFEIKTYACGAALLADPDISDAGCIVIDYRLADMNGLELISELRRKRINLPVILVTTNPSPLIAARIAKAGAVMIEKPFLNEALFDGIRAAMRR